jgi:hypothetical protein
VKIPPGKESKEPRKGEKKGLRKAGRGKRGRRRRARKEKDLKEASKNSLRHKRGGPKHLQVTPDQRKTSWQCVPQSNKARQKEVGAKGQAYLDYPTVR